MANCFHAHPFHYLVCLLLSAIKCASLGQRCKCLTKQPSFRRGTSYLGHLFISSIVSFINTSFPSFPSFPSFTSGS
ncbi:hypothetical protein VTH06DRAFT_2597 [Thermothelomyces fergusii]